MSLNRTWAGKLGGVFFSLILALAIHCVPARASTPGPEVPERFYLVSEDLGVRLYRRNYSGGNPDYVQVIDLSEGARLDLMHGEVGEPRKGKGMFGGDDYRFSYQTLGQFWRQSRLEDDLTFCVFNGQFFYMPESPTRLAMPLKIDGEMITSGFGYPQYDGEELMLELWPDEARISELSARALRKSTAPDIIAGLTENANKRAKYSVGRTFLGVLDGDGDRRNEIVLVLNTLSATQEHAASVLREWGAEPVMMLDGGGSTQLYCRDGWKIESERYLPQAIAVVAGSGPPFLAEFTRVPDWTVIVEGEKPELEIEVRNIGVEPWDTSVVKLMVRRLPWMSENSIPIPDVVSPGGTVAIVWPAEIFYKPGVYELETSMEQKGYEFPGEPIGFNVIVIPSELGPKRAELEEHVKVWSTEADADMVSNINSWIQNETGEEGGAPQVLPTQFVAQEAELSANNILWVPLLMLPFVVFLVLLVGRVRSID